MRILIVIAILLTTTPRLFADDAIKNYINISKKDGLANNSVSVIEDDVYGRIWIGTDGGLSIYDSNDLTTIYSYAGIEILALYDTGREMLIGTSAYIESYDYETGLFERVVFEGKDLVHVTSVLKYRDDVIIVANASVFIYANGSVRLVKSEVPYGLLESDKYGVLWGINNTNNVYRLDENYELVKIYRLGKTDDHSLRAISLFPDSKGLVCTLKDGLYRYNRVDDSFHKEDLASMYNMNEIDNILSINEDKDDRLWIGHNSKVSVYDYNNRAFRSYMFENIWNITLSTTITKIHRTRDRNMVLGSYFNGLFYVKDMDSNMKFFNVAGERKEEGGVVANGIVKDSDNRIWVGTNSMGISVLDATGKHIKQLTPDNSGISNDMIAMDMDEDGNIWSGSRSNGLYRISKNGAITRFFSHSGQEGTLSGNDIPALHSINRDSLIVGTSQGIDIYLRKTNTFVNLAGRDSRRFLFCNILPHNNKIWLVSYRSVWCFDRADGTIKEYPFVDQNAGLLSAYINEDGKLWLGTTQGDIFLFEDGNITPYITDKVLIGSSVAGIQGDADGNLWVAAGNNLLRVAQDKNIRKFDMSWGLGTMEFTARSSYVDGDGTIYFGSSNGLFSFNPKLVGSAESNHPKLFISDFKILDRSINSGNSNVLKKHINNTDKIVLNNDQNFISFYVTSIDYNSNYLSTTCMYQLENFDKNWYEVNERSHEISFTGLTAGSYTLNIRLISDNGEIVDSKSIDIEIKPHFLLSPVMIIVYIIVITLLIWGASVLVTKQRAAKALVRQAKAEQDEITRMNTLKLDLFTNISYAFKIPLSIISMLQEDLLPGNDEPDNDTVIFKRNVKQTIGVFNKPVDGVSQYRIPIRTRGDK